MVQLQFKGNDMNLDTFNQLFDLSVKILAILSPILGLYAFYTTIIKNELLILLDKAPVRNTSLENLAKNIGLHRAAKEIKKII